MDSLAQLPLVVLTVKLRNDRFQVHMIDGVSSWCGHANRLPPNLF